VNIRPADADLRRAFAYLAPYWRRLALVMAISLVSTGLSLVTPYLSKDLVDRALIGRDLDALKRIVLLFAALGIASYLLNVVSGLRYTRVSAEILFDMRLALYQQAGHMLVDDAAGIFTNTVSSQWLVKPYVTGYTRTTGINGDWPGWMNLLTVDIVRPR